MLIVKIQRVPLTMPHQEESELCPYPRYGLWNWTCL